MDRLALDILVFDPSGDFVDYVDDDCLSEPRLLIKHLRPKITYRHSAAKTQRLGRGICWINFEFELPPKLNNVNKKDLADYCIRIHCRFAFVFIHQPASRLFPVK